HALHVRGARDRVAKLVLGKAAQEVQRAGNQLAQAGQRGQRAEEVVARRRQEADAVVPGGELSERETDRGGLGLAESDQLLQLVDEKDQPLVFREVATELAGEGGGLVAEHLFRRFRVLWRQGACERGERAAARN